jgi:hypothetical protein
MAAKQKRPILIPKDGLHSLLTEKQQKALARRVPERLLFMTVEAAMCLSHADAATHLLSPQAQQWAEWTLRGLRRQRWKSDTVLLLRARRSLEGA